MRKMQLMLFSLSLILTERAVAKGNGIISEFADILQYGFMGLSILMVFLGYNLFRRVINQEETPREKVQLAKFFLSMAFLFLIGAGFLEFGSRFITAYDKKRSFEIILNVSPWTTKHSMDYGDLIVKTGKNKNTLKENMIPIQVTEDSEITLELYKLMDKMREMQTQINDLAIERGKKDEEAGPGPL